MPAQLTQEQAPTQAPAQALPQAHASAKPHYAKLSGSEPPSSGYSELHCISNYSFLRGASHPEELVLQAAALGYKAIAITDECSMAGVVKAHVAARECGIKLIVGSEFHLLEDVRIVLLATDRTA